MATNVLTVALAGGSPAEMIASDASPMVNNAIKHNTQDGSLANIMAHAAWGAIEAAAAKGNPIAGAVAAAGAEIAAPRLAEALYGTSDTEKLSEAQKRTIITLSSAVAGVASGIVGSKGNSTTLTQSVAKGMQIGENAVKHNFLSPKEWEELERYANKKNITLEEAYRTLYLMNKDRYSEQLLDKYQKGEINAKEFNDLNAIIKDYGSLPEQISRMNEPAYQYIKPDYSELEHQAKKQINYSNRTESQLAKSTLDGMALFGGSGGAIVKVGGALEKLGAVAKTEELIYGIKAEKGINNATVQLGNTAKAIKENALIYGSSPSYYAGQAVNGGLRQVNKTLDGISHITPSQYAKGFVLGAGANAGVQYAIKGEVNPNDALRAGFVTPYTMYTPFGTSLIIGAVDTATTSGNTINSQVQGQGAYLSGVTSGWASDVLSARYGASSHTSQFSNLFFSNIASEWVKSLQTQENGG